MTEPIIYMFSTAPDGKAGMCYAMAEDGHVLASHWCSSEMYSPYDLGYFPGYALHHQKRYHEHYPDGYRMQFVRSDHQESHEGLQRARAANEALRAAAT